MARRKLDQNKINEERKENKLKAFFMDNKRIVKYSVLGLLAISLTAGAISLALRNDNKDKGKVKIESAKETKKETINETKLEVSEKIEEEINKEIEEEIKKIEDKGLSKEDQEKQIEKAKEKIVERVAKENKVNKNNLNNIVERNVSKRVESSNKINNEIKEKAKETRKEVEKKIADTKKKEEREKAKETKPSTPSKPSETKPTQPKETKKEVTRTTETKSIDFKTIDNFAHTNGKSRVYQEGRSGERTIVKEDGKIVSDTITRKPQDKIIERYVKVQDKKTEIRKVEDKNSPIYDYQSRDRWFVNNDLTGEKKYFYSSDEAYRYFEDNKILGNWGTAEPELIKGDLIGYDKVNKEVVVQEEKWEWKH